MAAVIEDLGDDPVQLKARLVEVLSRNEELLTHNAELHARNTELEQLVAKFQRMIYGRRSERLADDRHPQLPFPGDEPEPPPPPHVDEAPDDETERVGKKPRQRGISRQRSDLPRVSQTIELPEEKRRCPCCGDVMPPIGETVTEELEFTPAVLRIRETRRIKYACKKHEEGGVVTPELPPRPIAKGVAGPSLIAQVVVSKFKDHLPLYRQNRIFERFGVDIPESTLGDWITGAAELLLPVVQSIQASILESFVVQTDDTGILVQDRNHQGGSRKSYLWGYVGDRGEVVFDFTAGRSRDGPVKFLGDYQGYLQADAYSGYDAVFRKGTIVEVGCWAHARRGFFEALETAQDHASDALAAIRVLYEVEAQAKALDPERRKQLRQERCKPVLEQMRPWLQGLKPTVLPKSPLGKAIGYALNQWDALNRYLEDGRLAIDNNRVERQIRSIAVGRKNWLFAGSDEGARRAAVHYSILGTCALQGVEPWAYLTDVLQRLAEGQDPATLTPRLWAVRQPAITIE